MTNVECRMKSYECGRHHRRRVRVERRALARRYRTTGGLKPAAPLTPADAELTSARAGMTPARPETTPAQTGTTPARAGTTARKYGAASAKAGTISATAQTGSATAERAYAGAGGDVRMLRRPAPRPRSTADAVFRLLRPRTR